MATGQRRQDDVVSRAGHRPGGSWETVLAPPHPRLRPGVIGYRGIRLDLDGAATSVCPDLVRGASGVPAAPTACGALWDDCPRRRPQR
ncbi:hypothetical protein [Streptomyces sp. NPDC058249]|uniref:hypothetical protein n=1 Tax=Streptomyces sp. NPDC058249 TaxID=3346403 RepID=UPI0036E5C237